MDRTCRFVLGDCDRIDGMLSTRSRKSLSYAGICVFMVGVSASQSLAPNPADYEGRYEYRDGGSLVMVASGERLIAIIGESKYPLRAASTDTFKNAGGDSIPFLRNANGRVVEFKENGTSFKRLSSTVPAASRLLLEPRPRRSDGRTIAYRYREPAKLPDGIRTGPAGPDTLPPGVAERLVNGVIDGVYPDVRSILVYRKGALLLEE